MALGQWSFEVELIGLARAWSMAHAWGQRNVNDGKLLDPWNIDLLLVKKVARIFVRTLDGESMYILFDTYIWEDSQDCIAEVVPRRLLHLSRLIDFKTKFLVNHTRKEDVVLWYVDTDEINVDVFTKNLPVAKIEGFVEMGTMPEADRIAWIQYCSKKSVAAAT